MTGTRFYVRLARTATSHAARARSRQLLASKRAARRLGREHLIAALAVGGRDARAHVDRLGTTHRRRLNAQIRQGALAFCARSSTTGLHPSAPRLAELGTVRLAATASRCQSQDTGKQEQRSHRILRGDRRPFVQRGGQDPRARITPKFASVGRRMRRGGCDDHAPPVAAEAMPRARTGAHHPPSPYGDGAQEWDVRGCWSALARNCARHSTAAATPGLRPVEPVLVSSCPRTGQSARRESDLDATIRPARLCQRRRGRQSVDAARAPSRFSPCLASLPAAVAARRASPQRTSASGPSARE